MKRRTRYDTTGLEEAQFEPGSRGRVLKNLLGIMSKRELGLIEGRELLRTLDALSKHHNVTH